MNDNIENMEDNRETIGCLPTESTPQDLEIILADEDYKLFQEDLYAELSFCTEYNTYL